MIRVYRPQIKKAGSDICRLEYQIVCNGEKKKLFFEFPDAYAYGLSIDVGDGILAGIFYYAMERKEDVLFDMPVTERLYYQLTAYLSDALHAADHRFGKIRIKADTVRTSVDRGGVESKKYTATGMSLGVDSLCTFYTQNYLYKDMESLNIDMLCLFDAGAFHYGNGGKYREDHGKNVFLEHVKQVERFAQDVKLPVFVVRSNIAELFPQEHMLVHTFRNCAIPLLFQNLFRVYYYSSAFPLDEIGIDPVEDAAHYDIFTLPNLSTDKLLFYSANTTYTRFRKTKQIARFKLAQKYLNVCTVGVKNCGQCAKCARTLMMLEAVGNLEQFGAVFDLDAYKKRKNMQIGYALASRRESHYKELVPFLKKHKKIPKESYLYMLFFKLAKPIEKTMRKMPPETRKRLVLFAQRHNLRVPF